MLYASKFILIYYSILTFITGLVFGSFLNCYADRYASHESILKGRSKCDNCKKELKVLDLIPIVSWAIHKGKCRYCGAKLSIKYPLSELICGIGFVLILLKFDLSLKTLIYLVLFSCLFALSLIDLKVYEIPDICIVIPIIGWVILNIFEKRWVSGLIGGLTIAGAILLIALIMDKILNRESLGGGDIKLLFVTGLYLGFVGNLFNLVLACLFGLLFVLIRKKDLIPFGPSIALACIVMLLYGSRLVDLYLGLF